MTCNRSVKWRKNWAYLLIAELSSSRRRASVVEVLSSLDRLSILFRITSSMSLIFLSTPRDSTPPSTEWRDTQKENKNLKVGSKLPTCWTSCTLITNPTALLAQNTVVDFGWILVLENGLYALHGNADQKQSLYSFVPNKCFMTKKMEFKHL